MIRHMQTGHENMAPIRNLFILGCQGLAADLLGFVVVLLWGLRVGLHVSSIEVFVGFRSDVLKHMRNSQLELISNWCNPRVILSLEDLLLTR